MRLIAIFLFCATVFGQLSAQKKIAIVPIGKVDKIFLDSACESIKEQFDYEVSILDFIEIKSEYKSTADSILCAACINQDLQEELGDGFIKILTLTESPLTIFREVHPRLIEKSLVRGYSSSVGGQNTTISLFKLRKESSEENLMPNFEKVVNHEIAHLFGLSHCDYNEYCLMLDGFKFDKNNGALCEKCQYKLDSILSQ